ncbi:MAG: NUDIX hydrolase [Planctomycetota bacterium]
MTLQPWSEISRERSYRYKVFDVLHAKRRSPRTGSEHGFFLVDTLDWVNVVARTVTDEIVLVKQYRHGIDEFTLELPGGCIDPGEDAAQAAVRELREESGFAGGPPRLLGKVTPNPAFLTNRCSSYLIDGCRQVGELEQDPGEDLEVVTLPRTEVEAMCLRGEIHHALVLNALYFLRLHDELHGGSSPEPGSSN